MKIILKIYKIIKLIKILFKNKIFKINNNKN